MKRPSKLEYYLNLADWASTRSTCLTSHYGCVIVKDDRVISTGYNGSPRGSKNCIDTGLCIRDCEGISRYNDCRAVHAEANAMLHASYNDLIGSTMYISRSINTNGSYSEVTPCDQCRKLIINAQIKEVICRQTDGSVFSYSVPSWTKTVVNGGSKS